ncbi:unnamed protein product [Camellia sinensis]
MAEPFSEVRLPQSVESMLQKICIEQFQSPPDTSVRKQLELLGEEVSLEILGIICTQKIRKSLSGFIMYLAKDYAGAPTQQDIYQSPHKRSSDDCYSPVNSPIRLPQSVESVLQKICVEQYQSPPGTSVRKQLELLGEEVSLEILGIICTQKIRKSLSGFIMHLAKDYAGAPTQQGIYQSPHKRSSDDCYSPVNSPDGVGPHSQVSMRPVFSPSSEGASTQKLSPQLLALSELEFRKGFLILSYIVGKIEQLFVICSNKLEDFMSADDVSNLKNLPMWSFEEKVWDDYGEQIKHCSDKDRPKYLDWDSGKTHLYYCHVYQDGSYTFKGPYLNCTRTHLQRVLGDENVLIVKFAEEATSCNNRVTGSSNYDAAFNKIAEEGILVGLRRFRFFESFEALSMTPQSARSLLLYITSALKSVGALLAQEIDGLERPVYYMSKVIQGAEIRYFPIERHCLALQNMRSLAKLPRPSRDLLAHFPSGEHEPPSDELSGDEFQAVKVNTEGEWSLSFDGSSTSKGGGAGIVLISLNQTKVNLSYKLDFKCSNNETEYEALILGLMAALHLGVSLLCIKGDSNLVVKQTNGDYAVKEPPLASYRTIVQRVTDKFDTVRVEHAPRSNNRHPDAFSSLASKVEFAEESTKIEVLKRSMPCSVTSIFPEKEPVDWRAPIIDKLRVPSGKLPLCEIKHFTIYQGVLYYRGPGGLLARCIDLTEAKTKLEGVHNRSCGTGDMSLYRRLQRQGYYWNSL